MRPGSCTWTFSYDDLDRLAGAQGSQPGNAFTNYCWSYDSFGNRLQQEMATTAFNSGSGGGSPCLPYNPQPLTYNANNQISGGPDGAPGYDAAGDVVTDPYATTGTNQYLYDAEGRVCAVESPTADGLNVMTGYVYDAEGQRVAKGTITSWSCDPSTNGFSASVNETDFILDQAGHQLTEMTSQGGTMMWAHTNVWAGSQLVATYSAITAANGQADGQLHFYLDDWLGTRRAQTDYAGVLERTCSSLPFGDQESCTPTPTENLFTGKERDTESGNDYFGARYYASTMGRFLSPDWAAKIEPVPYAKLGDPQSLNLYQYMENNPLGGTDPDGHCCEADFYEFRTPEQKAFHPSTDFDRQFVKTLAKFTVGGLAIAATGGAAAGIGEGIEAASAAGDLSLGTGLKIGVQTLGATGMGVGGVATVAGAATGTETEDAVSHVNAVTNPVAGAVALATNSATTGSNAADAVTVGKALGNLATGRAVENPAEAASSLGGAIDTVKSVAHSVGSYFSTPQPPPAPKPPSRPGCNVAGAC